MMRMSNKEFYDSLAQLGGWDDFDRMKRNEEHIDDVVKVYFNMCCLMSFYSAPFETKLQVKWDQPLKSIIKIQEK